MPGCVHPSTPHSGELSVFRPPYVMGVTLHAVTRRFGKKIRTSIERAGVGVITLQLSQIVRGQGPVLLLVA